MKKTIFYLYDHPKKPYNYFISDTELDVPGTITQSSKPETLKEFIGTLVLNGYPSDRLEIIEVLKKTYNVYDEPAAKKKLVDFENIDLIINQLREGGCALVQGMAFIDTKNLELFFQKISTSSSFAHKAHKELKKLSK